MRPWRLVLLLTVFLSGCGYRDFQQLDAERQAAWSALAPLYQQRTALVTILLNAARTLPGADPGQLAQLAQTRATAAALPVPGTLPEDTASLQSQASAQAALTAALAPVLQTARHAPGLVPMVGQFDGLENRITVARNRYGLATQQYNTLLGSFPSSLTARVMGLTLRPALPGNP
ncbi:MAG: LemA family protein [Burkholderiales bacterium]|nr:LemA family protein [Burkholderiales bacterium]